MPHFRQLRNPLLVASLLVGTAAPGAAQGAVAGVQLRAGMVITRSVRVEKRTWSLPADMPNDSGAIVIRGDNITVDFGGATLEGMAPQNDPDLASGVAIRVEGGRNVRIVNARIRGYKIAILARGTRNLTIEQVDASNNWKPRLFSLVEHESLVDWLSFHRNEGDEWLRFGAAFYLHGVTGGAVRSNRAEQGMNALLMVQTTGIDVTGNDFSFNSGLGIGLYRSSRNTITRNRVDFNVRGYSHGVYRRGQDSAGILLYEQSNGNVIAFNSGTHGGDGFFLWAGQSTMDTGEGGSNDNWVVGNDFSWAPANGIEATFSRNHFVGNRLEGNDYGIWGGYSFSSTVASNCFIGNRIGMAVEHGQDNTVTGNSFFGDTTAISLWANPIEPSDWGYPKTRDTRSRDYTITGNSFARHRVGVRAVNTSGIAFRDNTVLSADSLVVMRDTTAAVIEPNRVTGGAPTPAVVDGNCTPAKALAAVPAEIRERASRGAPRGGPQLPLQPLARRDRSAMIVDEWGPYDWQSPKLWPIDSVRSVPLRLRVHGPNGRWRVVGARGIGTLSREFGSMRDTIVVTPPADSVGDWAIELEFTGGSMRTPQGQTFGPGTRYRFGYERFEPRQEWNARFVSWPDSTARDAMGDAATRALAGPGLLRRTEPRLDYFWYRPSIAGLPQSQWAMEATSTIDLGPGEYSLRTISDDGVRVWVDGRLVIDRWTHHESTVDYAALTAGRHELRVQYFQADGWSELRLDIVRGSARSRGSAGPH